MKLLIIRHGIAEDKDDWASTGKSDDERPLTAEGQRDMARNAKGLRSIISSLDLIGTSPLVRARQTAAIVSAEFDDARVETTETLIPEVPLREFVTWLGAHGKKKVVGAVGHEPHLGMLATWLLTGLEESHIDLKKGAACLIQFDDAPGPGAGYLRWSAPPSLLGRL